MAYSSREKYRQEYVSYIEKEGKYYQQAGTDAEGNQLFYELNDALQKKDENEAPVPLTLSPGITNNVAVGNKATTKSSSSVAIGDNSQSQGYRGIAIGADSQAGDTTDSADYNDGISAVAIGDGAKALGNGSIATGQGSHAYGYASVASGVNAGANTTRAIAIGEMPRFPIFRRRRMIHSGWWQNRQSPSGTAARQTGKTRQP